MKLQCLLAIALFLPTSLFAESPKFGDLVKRDGLYCAKSADVPYTGTTSGRTQMTFKDGVLSGPYEKYYKNGQLSSKGSYRGGELHGPHESYYKDGQLMGKEPIKVGYDTAFMSGTSTTDSCGTQFITRTEANTVIFSTITRTDSCPCKELTKTGKNMVPTSGIPRTGG